MIRLRSTTIPAGAESGTIETKNARLSMENMDENLIDLYNARVRIKNSNMYTQTSFNATSSGTQNTSFGYQALQSNTTGYNNTAVGTDTLRDNTTGYNNTAISTNSLLLNTTGSNNTTVGVNSLYSNTTGSNNTTVGVNSLYSNTTGSNNTTVGVNSLYSNTTGINNTALGKDTLTFNTTGVENTAVGSFALTYTTGSGAGAGTYGSNGFFTTFDNCTGLGYLSMVSASNQVQLGGSGTSVYGASAYNLRSDIRDKADIRNTVLGLDFIEKVRPVDFKWNYRDDYFIYGTTEEEYTETRIEPNPNFNTELEESELNQRLITITETKTRTVPTREAITNDGSKTRNRYHHGVIAQEVKEVLDELGTDFGGYQDHKVSGGNDVLTIGYEEFIAPMIKAIQELSNKVKQLEQGNQ